ncbi:MAG: putative molybdenum carrier protein [Longimonas sp.]|uniref:putative molybdenum carrier protein n=1 Tax=Longimonas sp. TaxID=2039626 RepID=UPI00397515B3
MLQVTLQRIVSGGQTGVDRAALDAAMECGVPVGGWCPKGRRAEDGPIPARYPLTETPTERYAQRTAWNVRDSDGTLILHQDPLTGGTALTQQEAEQRGRPWRVVTLGTSRPTKNALQWLHTHSIEVLNVAGPRASEEPGIYAAALAFVKSICEQAT